MEKDYKGIAKAIHNREKLKPTLMDTMQRDNRLQQLKSDLAKLRKACDAERAMKISTIQAHNHKIEQYNKLREAVREAVKELRKMADCNEKYFDDSVGWIRELATRLESAAKGK